MFSCENLTKSYGAKRALDNFSVDCKQAKLIALLGPNGAGKSTLADILVGLKKPDSGEYKIKINNPKMAAQFQNAPIFQSLNLYDNFALFCASFGVEYTKEQIEEIMQKYSLFEQRNILAKNLSNGQKQALSIALALIAKPNFIIFDEPMNNLDPKMRLKIRRQILELKDSGANILLISHDLAEIDQMAEYYIFIKQGSLVIAGSKEEICQQYKSSSLEEIYSKIYQ